MSVIKINVLEVPEGRRETLEARFAARAGEVETVDGFESFELLRPTDGTDHYLVVTRWRDDAAFRAWLESAEFRRGHAHGDSGADVPQASRGDAAPGGGHEAPAATERPAAAGSQLWEFEIVTSASAR